MGKSELGMGDPTHRPYKTLHTCIAGNFRGSVGMEHFVEKIFAEFLTDCINGCGMPKIPWRKLSRMAVKSRNS